MTWEIALLIWVAASMGVGLAWGAWRWYVDRREETRRLREADLWARLRLAEKEETMKRTDGFIITSAFVEASGRNYKK